MATDTFPQARGLTRHIRLTPVVVEREIKAARSRGGRTVLLDQACPGLRLVIGSRTASWTVTARPRGVDLDGKRHQLKTHVIGDAVDLSPDDARASAAVIKRAVACGGDPTAERKERQRQAALATHAEAENAESRRIMLERALQPRREGSRQVSIIDFSVMADAPLRDCARAFGLHAARGKADHVDDTVRHLLRGLDEMHALDLRPAELKQARIAALVDLHAKAGRPATARHRLGALNRLFKWLTSVDAVSVNPAAAVAQPAPPRERSNVLSAADIKALWDGTGRLPTARAAYLKLAILLPLRRQELADLKVSDVVFEGQNVELRLDGSRTKNSKTFVMPIVGTATAIVRGLVDQAPSRDALLIPLTRSGQPFSAWKRFHEQIESETGITLAWHDLRRTFATELGEHSAAPFGIVDGLLNHAQAASKSGAARAYHHAVERLPKTAAMNAWDSIVAHAVSEGCWVRDVGPHLSRRSEKVPYEARFSALSTWS